LVSKWILREGLSLELLSITRGPTVKHLFSYRHHLSSQVIRNPGRKSPQRLDGVVNAQAGLKQVQAEQKVSQLKNDLHHR
jgi:hypothetical protein